jgi:hypothetical protein
MAALRGRSFGRGFAFDGVEVEVAAIMGFDCCASFSVKLMSGFALVDSLLPVECCVGGLVSLTWGIVPAIEVSGISEFRGGGGGESNEEGVNAVLVCILRFDD